jgi:broad specificity phosphatase PhoE
MIRHGKSEANENYDILREKEDSEIELIDQGYLDAVEAGRNLKVVLKQNTTNASSQPCFVVSPYTRTRQTFSIISTVLNTSIDTVSLLPEIVEHFMNLKGNEANWEKFTKYQQSEWNVKDNEDVQFEGGESLNDVRYRAKGFISDVKGYFKEDCPDSSSDVVLVGHGLFIKMVIAELDGVEPDNVRHPENGELVIRDIV